MGCLISSAPCGCKKARWDDGTEEEYRCAIHPEELSEEAEAKRNVKNWIAEDVQHCVGDTYVTPVFNKLVANEDCTFTKNEDYDEDNQLVDVAIKIEITHHTTIDAKDLHLLGITLPWDE